MKILETLVAAVGGPAAAPTFAAQSRGGAPQVFARRRGATRDGVGQDVGPDARRARWCRGPATP